MDNHTKNHLPNPASAPEMEKALNGLGLADNFEVKRPVVYVDASTKELTAEIDYKKKI